MHFNAGECLSAATPQRRRLATARRGKTYCKTFSFAALGSRGIRRISAKAPCKNIKCQSQSTSINYGFNEIKFQSLIILRVWEPSPSRSRPPQKEKVGWGSMNAQRRKKIWLAKSRQVGPSFCDWDIIGTLSDELLLCFDIRWKRLTWALAEKKQNFQMRARTWSQIKNMKQLRMRKD